jgi:chorismate synthase
MLRFLTAGESHGEALVGIIEGLPAGVPLSSDEIVQDLARRRRGHGRGERMRSETDELRILSGFHRGVTTGAPFSFTIMNAVKAVPQDSDEAARCPRPGHADLSGGMKYGLKDFRIVAERASARETAARVVVGSVARQLLRLFSIEVVGWVESVGSISIPHEDLSCEELRARVETSSLRVPHKLTEDAMTAIIDEAASRGDTLGGIFAIGAWGVPAGLGSYVHADRRLDAILVSALVSIPAVKGAEVGPAFENARLCGSQVHDAIVYRNGWRRATNRAGGIEGGVSNGEPILLRAAMKPIPTLGKGLETVNVVSRIACKAPYRRSDVTALPAASVVGEAVVAWEIVKALHEKLGGDTLEEMRGAWRKIKASLEQY